MKKMTWTGWQINRFNNCTCFVFQKRKKKDQKKFTREQLIANELYESLKNTSAIFS